MYTVFKISAGPWTLTGKTGVVPAGFPSLPYTNFGKIVLRSGKFHLFWRLCICGADSRFAPSQWETALLCNDVSHWLDTNLESALYMWVQPWRVTFWSASPLCIRPRSWPPLCHVFNMKHIFFKLLLLISNSNSIWQIRQNWLSYRSTSKVNSFSFAIAIVCSFCECIYFWCIYLIAPITHGVETKSDPSELDFSVQSHWRVIHITLFLETFNSLAPWRCGNK